MPTWLTPAAAKFWVAVVGSFVIAFVQALGDSAPRWAVAAVAGLTAIAVYLTPNQPKE